MIFRGCYIALALILPFYTFGQTVWISAGDGHWAVTNNWSSGIPDLASAAAITNQGTKVITVDAQVPLQNLGARRITLSAPEGSSNTLRLSNLPTPFQLSNTFSLEAGGVLEVIGSVMTVDGALGGNFNLLAGDLKLLGGELRTTNNAGMRIGRVSEGRALISGGRLLAGSDCTVGGLTGSSGTLTLSEGVVTVAGQLTIADNPGSYGRVYVTGGTLMSTNSTTRLGDDGAGELTITGGQVLLEDLSVGRGAASEGKLLVSGGALEADSISIARFPDSKGVMEVTGGIVTASALDVGREGDGVFRMFSGVANFSTVSVAPLGTGLLELKGGTLAASHLAITNATAQVSFEAGRLELGSTIASNGTPFVVGDGVRAATMHLAPGLHVFASGLVISSNATLSGTGVTLSGAVTVLPGGVNLLNQTPVDPVTITALKVDQGLRLTFPSAAGRFYDVEMSTSLLPGSWRLLTTLPGTGAVISLEPDALGETKTWYRVRIRQ